MHSSISIFLEENGFISQVWRGNVLSPMMKNGVGLSSLGRGTSAGNPMSPLSMHSQSSDELKIWASVALPLAPTFIHKSHQNYRMKLLIVEIKRTTALWIFHGYVLPVHGTQIVVEIPPWRKEISNQQSFSFSGRCCNHFSGILIYDGLSNVSDNWGNGVVSYPEVVHQTVIAVHCC